jgi:hypothetical protein
MYPQSLQTHSPSQNPPDTPALLARSSSASCAEAGDGFLFPNTFKEVELDVSLGTVPRAAKKDDGKGATWKAPARLESRRSSSALTRWDDLVMVDRSGLCCWQ